MPTEVNELTIESTRPTRRHIIPHLTPSGQGHTIEVTSVATRLYKSPTSDTTTDPNRRTELPATPPSSPKSRLTESLRCPKDPPTKPQAVSKSRASGPQSLGFKPLS